jgi:hypothetical protein
MALNVMLVFFRNYNSDQLRYLEKWYILFSYGVPFIPCLCFIIIDHYGKQRIIGPATVSADKLLKRTSCLTSVADLVLDRL